jgi:hypothetical protein
MSRDTKMSAPFTACGPTMPHAATSSATTASQPSMFSAEDFHASPTPLLADEEALKTTATSGRSSPDSFASLNPDGSWRKTSQGYSQMTLDGSLEAFSETWPRAGMTRSGTAYLLPPLAPLTDATESGLWRTPQAGEGNGGGQAGSKRVLNGHSMYLRDQVLDPTMWPTPCAQEDGKTPEAHLAMKARMKGGPRYTITSLAVAVKRWPTPVARDYKGQGMSRERRATRPPDNLCSAVHLETGSGSLNPTWVEWLMGYPLGWTDCGDSATRSSRRSRSGSAGASSRPKRGSRSHE